MSNRDRIRRVAVIGVSHWHSIYDASYLQLLAELDVDIVGVSDADPAIARARAERFSTQAYDDYALMLERTRPEFIIALGRHFEMPALFRHLLQTDIPFMMEKPWGTRLEEVRELVSECERMGAWAAVPFMTRYTHWARKARELYLSRNIGAPSHLVFRMIRPTARRYVEWDSPWMLDKSQAGGGALINLGSHGFDISRFITDEEPEVLSCILSNRAGQGEVEDYAHVVLKTPSGLIIHNEVGYTMPTWPVNATDGERKLASSRMIVRAAEAGVEMLSAEGRTFDPTPSDFVAGHRRVLIECLDAASRGAPPPVGPRDCLRAVEMIHAAYSVSNWA